MKTNTCEKIFGCQVFVLLLQHNQAQMQITLLTAIAKFLDASRGSDLDYSIKGYHGFAYLSIHWADGTKRYRFEVNVDGTVSMEDDNRIMKPQTA